MAYDLLIKNGRIIDGTGSPAFKGDLGVRDGKIAEIGKLRESAKRTIDAAGLAVAPGFIDTHCHYDAQVTWDPLCTFSCDHGVTTVINGNCSLALAPVKRGTEERLLEFLSYVEAIPMEALKTVEMNWETIPEYMDVLDRRLGVNVGTLIGHTAVRHYVMGEDCQKRAATAAEIEAMRGIVREGITAGALGLSFSRNKGQYDPRGLNIPTLWAEEDEIFGLADVLGELGTGVIQSGGGMRAEEQSRLMSRLAEATGRQVVFNALNQAVKNPEGYKKHMAIIDEAVAKGLRANPMCTPNIQHHRFTLRNTQEFKGVPTWHPIMIAPDDEKLRAYKDPEVRRKLHEEVIEWKQEIPGNTTLDRNWYDSTFVAETALDKNKGLVGKSLGEIAKMQGKGIIDAFLDLAVEENLDTVFVHEVLGYDKAAAARILNYQNAYIGLSDGGAHVQFQCGAGLSSRFLGYWVRQENVMSLEQAVKRLTSESAAVFGIYDRGMLRPGLAADITIFNPETIRALPEEKVFDFPAGAWRMRERAVGLHYTIVNGQVLIEDGKPTGALPGRVLRNSLYHERAGASS